MFIIENLEEFKLMMKGGYGRFSRYELWSILSNLNELHINTIYTQQLVDGSFVCAVDEPTVRYFLKEEGQI